MKKYIRKIKNILFGFTGTAIYCSRCKSLNVTFGESEFSKNAEIYIVECKDCRAFGIVSESWFDEGCKAITRE